MTAEIAILTKGAIALSADSAMTVGGGLKIYNSASKLFTLSKYHPVGVMIYGNAEYMGMPWELVIKQYRERLGRKAFGQLRDYKEDFVDFLQDYTNFVTPRVQEIHFREVVSLYFKMMVSAMLPFVDPPIASIIKPTQTQIDALVQSFIASYFRECVLYDLLPPWTQYDIEKCIWQYDGVITDIIVEAFGKKPISYEALSYTAIDQLKEMALSFFSRNGMNPWYSGVVIAGYGETDLFPGLISFGTEGCFDGKLKLIPLEEHFIDYDKSSAVMAFAQDEVVHTFINGISPNLLGTLYSLIEKLTKRCLQDAVESMQELIPAEQVSAVEKNLKKAFRSARREFRHMLGNEIESGFIDPVMTSFDFLPNDELAAVAESLVSLTSFRQRISTVQETVGGPIDVALITKGDGFVWVKRKGYFDQRLNHAFFANYFRERTPEEGIP